MRYAALFSVSLALSFSCLAFDAAAEDTALEGELKAKYPRPPKALDGDPAQSCLLLVEFDFNGIIKLNGLDGAALVKTGDGGEVIRASTMKGRLVLFDLSDPGSYSLRFVRASNYNAVVVLEKPSDVEMNVVVARGEPSYLGTVVVTKKFGPKPPVMELTYDAKREKAAWSAFTEKYSTSPWNALVQKRLSQRPPAVATAANTGVVLSATPRESPVDEAEQRMLAMNEIAGAHRRKGEYASALRVYEEAIRMKPEPADVLGSKARRWVQGNLAWLLATCPNDAVRNGPRAVALAAEVVASTPQDVAYLDTLAAAYAEAGRFEEALTTQQKALAPLKKEDPLRDEYRNHLKSYEGKKAWRDPARP